MSIVSRSIILTNELKAVQLENKKYSVYVIGGWSVDLGEFSLAFKDIRSQKIATCSKVKIPLQTYYNGCRAKRILTVKIPSKSTYKVLMEYHSSLKVKTSNLYLTSIIFNQDEVPYPKILISEAAGLFRLGF